jgi:glutathione S-transferase
MTSTTTNTNSAAKPKLTYFNGRGRAEIIRLIFALAGVEYEDIRFQPNADNAENPSRPNEQLLEFKKTGKSVTGQVPYLEIDNMQLVQSLSIARYLSAKYGFLGNGEVQRLQHNIVVDTLEDFRLKFYFAILIEKDEAKKAELTKAFWSTEVPKFAAIFEKLLDNNPLHSGYFVGEKVGLSDLAFFDFWGLLMNANPEATKPFEKLAAHNKLVGSLPAISAWVAKRPQTPF